MSKFKLKYLSTDSPVWGFAWTKKYEVSHETMGVLFYISTSLGRCCGFNMMEGVRQELWDILWDDTAFPHKELKQFLQVFKKDRYDNAWNDLGIPVDHAPIFKIGELFWTQNTNYIPNIAEEFVPMFEWQSASEPRHTTTMFKYSFGD